jgi:undecaprenyl diphosphate synthase
VAPRHLAVIPDGSRRYAKKDGVAIADGYRVGARKALEVVHWCLEAGVDHLSAFASSQENVTQRPPEEVCAIHSAVGWFCAEVLAVAGVGLRVFGDPERLPECISERRELIRLAGQEPPAAPLMVYVGVNYSGHVELAAVVDAVEREGRDAVARPPERALLSAGIPPVDLLLRTGGQRRLSGFLPMQSAYAELCFVDALWPELTRAEFERALDWYATQDRRFGE